MPPTHRRRFNATAQGRKKTRENRQGHMRGARYELLGPVRPRHHEMLGRLVSCSQNSRTIRQDFGERVQVPPPQRIWLSLDARSVSGSRCAPGHHACARVVASQSPSPSTPRTLRCSSSIPDVHRGGVRGRPRRPSCPKRWRYRGRSPHVGAHQLLGRQLLPWVPRSGPPQQLVLHHPRYRSVRRRLGGERVPREAGAGTG